MSVMFQISLSSGYNFGNGISSFKSSLLGDYKEARKGHCLSKVSRREVFIAKQLFLVIILCIRLIIGMSLDRVFLLWGRVRIT